MIALAVMVAGAFGAVARFVVDGAVRHRWPAVTPWGTFVINVTGSAILGVLAGLVVFHGAPHELRTILGTGFCGGYTTFSTAVFESVRLAQNSDRVGAGVYAVASVAGSVAACAAGMGVAGLF
ncbi:MULTISPECIES: fluoride efflux transporter FluC [Mycobacteriales]|uniref:fluoride efflux transporter FluC n=1 Tax=Mycobacteriales TaxID=85007 RepID=UPI0009CD275E|nr:CrcB family protein [Gordonia sp. YY1]ART90649.1 chromosome condensation protein CrcB [Rhodococcus rhodochrous]KAF0969018.1 putative fluoride ion transporter CrcB [Gordonia sp. YY1]OOL33136.1 Chromosome condensation protein CrcB [Rhodococcus rhodochrous]